MKVTAFPGRPSFHFAVLILFLVTFLFPIGDVSAARVAIPGIFNTGVDDDGKKLNDEDPEIHYLLTGDADAAFVISDDSRPGLWTPSKGQSAWIGPENGNISAPQGNYFYTLTFDLYGLVPESVEISGLWAADNESEIFINGNSSGIKRENPAFIGLEPFEITSNLFIEGENSLEFLVKNLPLAGANPTGLLLADLEGFANEVPVPGAVWLLGSALITLGGIKRRLRG